MRRGHGKPHDLAGASAPPRRKAVPNGDQQVAVRNRRPAGHDISLEHMRSSAREARARTGARASSASNSRAGLVGHVRAIPVAIERQDRVKLEAEVQRDLGGDLVGPVCERRDEEQPRRRVGKESQFARQHVICRGAIATRSSRSRLFRASTASAARASLRWPVTPTARTNGRRRRGRFRMRQRADCQVQLRSGDCRLLQMQCPAVSVVPDRVEGQAGPDFLIVQEKSSRETEILQLRRCGLLTTSVCRPCSHRSD